jgi:hypothetical protein
MSHSAKPLFYRDYCVKTLEIKGDYEIWAKDIEEYFTVSGLPAHFSAIIQFTEPDDNDDLPQDAKNVDLKVRHQQILQQARYAIYRSLGDTVKKEMAKERYDTSNAMHLWRAVRSCFYLIDESTVQQIRDDIQTLDLEKAGSWNSFTSDLEKLYARLDVVAGERSYTPSDKLHKLRNTLSKLEGEKEKNIANQIELLVDSSDKDPKDLYDQCYKFADKRMKILNPTTTAKGTAFYVSKQTTTCNYCKKSGHIIKDCPTKPPLSPEERKRREERRVCRTWNDTTKICRYEKDTGKKCRFKHPNSVNSVQEADADPDSDPNIVWMFTSTRLRVPPPRNVIQGTTFNILTSRPKDRTWAQKWIIDGAATINLSNGVGYLPGTKKSKLTVIEVVGQAKVECYEVADFDIPTFLPDGSASDILHLKEIPILRTLKYNLISEKQFTSLGLSILKTDRNCWIVSRSTLKSVAYLASSPSLYFLGTTPTIAQMVKPCPWYLIETPTAPPAVPTTLVAPEILDATQEIKRESRIDINPKEKALSGPKAIWKESLDNQGPPPLELPLCSDDVVEIKTVDPVPPSPRQLSQGCGENVFHTHVFTQENMSKLFLWHTLGPSELRINGENFHPKERFFATAAAGARVHSFRQTKKERRAPHEQVNSSIRT